MSSRKLSEVYTRIWERHDVAPENDEQYEIGYREAIRWVGGLLNRVDEVDIDRLHEVVNARLLKEIKRLTKEKK